MSFKDSKLRWGPEHVNNDVLCAFDIRVGGLNPIGSDILEVCFVPLNHSYRPHGEFLPFHMRIKPDFLVDTKIAKLSKPLIEKDYLTAHDATTVADLFEHWWSQIRVSPQKKLILVGHQIVKKMPWLHYWLGGAYSEIISEEYRDIGTVMHFLNDKADYHGDPVPFKNQKFGQFALATNSPLFDKNSLMANCKTISDGYRFCLKRTA